MNEHDPESNPEPNLDPEEEARVRALLTDLGGESSIPPEVAARLDETLAGLVAERAVESEEPESAGNVVPLRRRWAPRAAAAAAAVIVIGAGGVAAANLGVFGGNDDSMTSADGAASSKAESGGDTAPSARSPQSGAVQDSDLPQFTAESFTSHAQSLTRQSANLSSLDALANQREPAGKSSAERQAARVCAGPKDDGSQHLAILYDGDLAALLVHPESDGKRLVEAWTCDGERRLDSATVPVWRPTSGRNGSGLASPSPSPQD